MTMFHYLLGCGIAWVCGFASCLVVMAFVAAHRTVPRPDPADLSPEEQ